MPTYEYFCPLCQARSIVAASINEKITPPTCLNCDVTTVRLYSLPPIHFKGEGWAGKK